MKLKKVEISAFRIYDDPKDGTFDLTTKSGSAAGFVSLYAPNGFGKTSFYDAVEYGMTESVDRFYLRAAELEKLAGIQSLGKFIQNTNSERETYVRLTTDNEKTPIVYQKFKKHGKQRFDLNFDSKKRKEHPFQKVILSQEWISAFLTESDGETRYRKFMTNPELSNVDNYYINLKLLLKALNAHKETLNKPINTYNEKTESIGSSDVLKTINDQIKLLVESFNEKSFKFLSLNTTQEEIKDLRDVIAGKIITEDREGSLKEDLSTIAIARSGNSEIIGMNAYFDVSEEREKKISSLATLNQRLEDFSKLNQQEVAYENKKLSKQKEIEHQNTIDNLMENFKEYLTIRSQLETKEDRKKEIEKTLQDDYGKVSFLNGTVIENKSLVELTVKQLAENSGKKIYLPEARQRTEKLELEIARLDSELALKKGQMETSNSNLQIAKQESLQFEKILDGILKGQYPDAGSLDNAALTIVIQNLEKLDQELINERQLSEAANDAILEQQNLSQTISEFIKSGLSIVNDRQTSSCPLCEEVYNSHDALVERIVNNKSLDKALQVLFEKKSVMDARIIYLFNQIETDRAPLILTYSNRYRGALGRVTELESAIRDINMSIQGLNASLVSFRKDREELISSIGGLSFEEYTSFLDTTITNLTTQRDEINTKLTVAQHEISVLNSGIESAKQQLELVLDEMKVLRQNQLFASVLNWFSQNASSDSVNVTVLSTRKEIISKSIENINDEMQQLEKDINDLKISLNSYTRDNLNGEKTELEYSIQEISNGLEAFRIFLKDRLKIESPVSDKSSLKELLDQRQEAVNLALATNKLLIDEYKKFSSFGENVWNFLVSENARVEAENAKSELMFLRTNVEPLIQSEFKNAKEHLEEKIKNFFHVDLINELYKKIDPHPEFKSVEFRANFESDNPRLDVFVKKTDDENILVPNLYFSTAQINILSLSIFLAAALKETQYKCIFIDDPIQSMDNINVLSTIDLLRSIVVNEDRQIILSTHDENFHNLMKKKMPTDLFESKFLELESFGKVKAQTNLNS